MTEDQITLPDGTKKKWGDMTEGERNRYMREKAPESETPSTPARPPQSPTDNDSDGGYTHIIPKTIETVDNAFRRGWRYAKEKVRDAMGGGGSAVAEDEPQSNNMRRKKTKEQMGAE